MSSQIQTLNNQFNSLLSEYQNIYQNYTNSLNSSDINLTIVPDSAYVSDSILNSNTVSSVDDCKTTCTSNSSCTGATFNSSNENNCVLGSGNGNIINYPNSSAIVQDSMYYSYQLKQLNDQLMSINQQMLDITKQSYGTFQQTQQQTQQQEIALQQNYQSLMNERDEIERMVRQFETLNEANKNGEIVITSNYSYYILLLFISIVLIFVLIKFSASGQQRGGGIGNNFKNEAMFLFLIMFGFLGLSQVLKNYNGYIFVSILVIAYLVIKMKLNE
jgi:hypothetical protein